VPSANEIALTYVAVCELELQAFKPGNVSVYAPGHGMTVDDFSRSAEASAPFLADRGLGLGEKIFRAIEATRRAARCNTNLGIVLLAAPLTHAVLTIGPDENLRTALGRVLAGTTTEDAVWAYRAIALAAPGGLGRSDTADVSETPEITLQQAMAIASKRDRVAHQYVHDYADVFDFAIPRYHSARLRWGDDAWAAAEVYVRTLKRIPDSHLERKYGTRFNAMVAARMADLEQALSRSVRPEHVLSLFRQVDAEFKSHGINPGTTADLTVTCLLADHLETLLSQRKQRAPCLVQATGARGTSEVPNDEAYWPRLRV